MITIDTYTPDVKKVIGGKAAQLFVLANAGYKVPPLVTLTCDEVESILRKGQVADFMINELTEPISAERYIVRSAVLDEDTKHSAQAGVFTSVPDIPKEGIADSILQVATDAQAKTGKSDAISIIIQEYITADYGGVLFTRHPAGHYSQVLEYQSGSAEQVVHGESVNSVEFCRSSDPKLKKIPLAAELVQQGGDIEQLYNWPQDIEWVTQDNQLYLVQTRPITTISQSQYEAILLLDRELEGIDDFYYEVAPAAETFHDPTLLSFSILERLYSVEGSIKQAYARHGVTYVPQNEHRQFGAGVYVDKQKELQAIMPAYSYVEGGRKLRLLPLGNLVTTLRNSWKMARISPVKEVVGLKEKLNQLLSVNSASIEQSIKQLDECYETIYSVSLCTQKAVNDVQQFLGVDGKKYLTTLITPTEAVDINDDLLVGLKGNSLNIDDESDFSLAEFKLNDQQQKAAETWLQSLPDWKQSALQRKIDIARQYMELREISRVLSVKLISQLRFSISQLASDIDVVDKSLFSFATLDELLSKKYNTDLWTKRQLQYQSDLTLDFPRIISSYLNEEASKTAYGLSAGEATGRVVSVDTMGDTADSKILLVDTLYPELVQYFPKISGIVTRNGGLLSHAAIMAREAGLPVVVNTAETIELEQSVKVDGGSGKLTKQ